jgi:hypothetical protein
MSYSPDFYDSRIETADRSAEVIVPLVMDLVHPNSVADVGCALGAWLQIFRDRGVDRILGVDGDWVDRDKLEIPAECFLARDLSDPLWIDRQFDLVISLEVAEHLPPEDADTFIDSLVKLGSVILFSAAVPFQGGTRHVNERWLSYWARRFQKRGYLIIDCLRRRIWDDERVAWWYAQNMVFFVNQDDLVRYPLLEAELAHGTDFLPLDLVHPRNYLRLQGRCSELEASLAASDPERMSLRETLSLLPVMAKNALRRRIT